MTQFDGAKEGRPDIPHIRYQFRTKQFQTNYFKGSFPSPTSTRINPVRNIRLKLAYDGTDFVGWQEQANGLSIQRVVTNAIREMTQEEPVLLASGRTDSGVHAVGQVAHFLTETRIPAERLCFGLNALVPDSITILEAIDVPLAFHSRYHAVRKWYRYVIDNSRTPLPFWRRFSHHARNRLDVAAMQRAGDELVGTHDFRAFETQYPNRDSSVRTILKLSVQRYAGWPIGLPGGASSDPPNDAGDFVCLDVTADGFLYNMVRCIAGTLLEVGRGKWDTDDVVRIMHEGIRSRAGITAPAKGLFLMRVDYE